MAQASMISSCDRAVRENTDKIDIDLEEKKSDSLMSVAFLIFLE